MGALEGKVAVITGSSMGIGAAIARALHAEGARVVLNSRDMADLRDVAKELGNERVLMVEADLVEDSHMQTLIDATLDRWGQIDIFVNNAGTIKIGWAHRGKTSDWRYQFDINLWAYLTGTRLALPHMLARGQGDLVFIDSIAGRHAVPLWSCYTATKFAVRGFAESLREELQGTGVRLTIVEPGLVATNVLSQGPTAVSRVFEKGAKLLRPEDVAAAVQYAVTRPPDVSLQEIVIQHRGLKL
ncbi:MAG: SDR family oxidoreductase [Anaerolineae bacterium]